MQRKIVRYRALHWVNKRPVKGPWHNTAIDAWADALEMGEDAIVQEVEMGSPVRIRRLTNPFVSATVST